MEKLIEDLDRIRYPIEKSMICKTLGPMLLMVFLLS
jgi:hypothetical protein